MIKQKHQPTGNCKLALIILIDSEFPVSEL